jgi:hypothetical protein
MDKDNAKRLEALERCVDALEKASTQTDNQDRNTVDIDVTLPEADIDGLHFNKQEVRAVFEKQEDGNYYSRDILFNSARDTDEGTGRDLLSEYLDSEAVREAFRSALGEEVRFFLPEENQGAKNYNGVSWWYWLRPRSSGSAANFCISGANGLAYSYLASGVGGCAPVFRVVERDGQNETKQNC